VEHECNLDCLARFNNKVNGMTEDTAFGAIGFTTAVAASWL
jgi:hypothetical protein